MVRTLGLLLVAGNVIVMLACGSSGGGNNGASTVTAVSVSCSPSTVTSGQTSQCSANVSGTGNFSTAVTWNPSAGSISSTGLLTAPIVTSTTSVTVTATSTQNSAITGTATVTVNATGTAANVAPLVVDPGPAGATGEVNLAYVTVTVCVPGTSQCQTIDHIQVDTGSSGLRILSSVLNIPLPAENDSSGNPLNECLVFADGYVWGPVDLADITISGEVAGGVPVHVMTGDTAPSTCSSQTTGSNEGGSVSNLGANGLLGVGLFQQDCGQFCVTNSSNPYYYYDCPSSGCTPTTATLAQQVPNPANLFATDNNGVLIQLPAVPQGGTSTVEGSLIFGIGTESNNGLSGATVYNVPDSGSNAGNITTVFNGQSYPQSFIDSGSNGLFFLNSSLSGVATCSGQSSSWYCPSTSPDNLSAGNQGSNMSSPVTVNFTIEDANSLFNANNGGNSAFSTLGGPNCSSGGSNCAFDWGLPFFYGRNVFTAIENMNTPIGGPGPYFAY